MSKIITVSVAVPVWFEGQSSDDAVDGIAVGLFDIESGDFDEAWLDDDDGSSFDWNDIAEECRKFALDALDDATTDLCWDEEYETQRADREADERYERERDDRR